jgi:hypothetical protein
MDALLETYHITFPKGSKTKQQLQEELTLGESVLVEENGNLFRKVRVVVVHIATPEGHELLHVCKKDSTTGRMFRHTPRPMSEKIQLNESVLDAAKRGVLEELGPQMCDHLGLIIPDQVPLIRHEKGKSTSGKSTSGKSTYGSLESLYELYDVHAQVDTLEDLGPFQTLENNIFIHSWIWH